MPEFSHELAVEYLPLDFLVPNPRNARTHSQKQLHQIASSIQEFGFTNPILIDAGKTIIAGHGRATAAKTLGILKVPVIRLEHLTDAQVRAYIIADNRLAEKAGWDNAILAIELQHLIVNTDFEVTLTGFDMPEIDLIIQNAVEPEEEKPLTVDTDARVVSKSGDLWLLGEHRILCANALQDESYHVLLQGEQVRMVFTDPPYNVPVEGHVSGLGKVKHKDFAMACGEMNSAEFTSFLKTAMQAWVRHSCDGSIHYICMDWRHMGEVLAGARGTYSELKNLCIWNKDNAGMGSLYRSKHELVFVFKNGHGPHINNVELGRHGRYRTNVWDYPGQTTLHASRQQELSMHPTVKPVAMVADAILDCSGRGDSVLDAFGGSGTTLIAAEKTGREARLMELDPRYVDVTIRRWQELTGMDAKQNSSGETFNATEAKEAGYE